MTAQQLKDWRTRLGLSQREAAEALGLCLRTYQYYEAGEYPIPRAVELAALWLEAHR